MSLPKATATSTKRKPSGKKKTSWRGKRRNALPRAPTGSFASRQETFSKTGVDGQVYDMNDLSLANLPVCQQMAQFYQYYRITSVQMRFKPAYDTFVAPGVTSGNPQLPYLYFLYDKSGSLGLLNSTQFEEAGAKPIRFDDKTIIRKWRPSVVTTSSDLSVTQFKTSPWLPTHENSGLNLNNVLHTGAVWYISKMNATDALAYDIDITVTVQFRKPLVTPSATTPSKSILSA